MMHAPFSHNKQQNRFARGAKFFLLVLCLLPFLLQAEASLCRAAISASDHKTLHLLFTGNKDISAGILEKTVSDALADFLASDYPEAKADDAAFLVETLYRKQGYHFARVGYRITAEDGATTVEFPIQEGPQVHVGSISITGNTAFTDKELLAFFDKKNGNGIAASLFVETRIRDAANAIGNLYAGEGFLQAAIDPPAYHFSEDRSQVNIHLEVKEGVRTVVGKILYEGEILAQADSDLQSLVGELSGKAFLRRRKLMLKSGVLEIYGNLGYPETVVKIAEQRANETTIDLVCSIVSGPRVTVAAIEVSGNERTDTSFIITRLALQPGDLYTFKKKRESFLKLYQTGLFSSVAIQLAKEGGGTDRILHITVEEVLARQFFLYSGWGSYEMLRASTGFQDKNIFGAGRIFRFELGGSMKSANIEATVRDPWLLGSNITADLPVFFRSREEPSFTREEFGASILFSKSISKDLYVSLRYLYSSTETKDIIESASREPESDYTIASVKLQTTLDSRNEIFFPTAGHKIFGSAEIAEPAMGSGLSFFRFNFGMRKFLALNEKNTLAMRYDTGVILPGRNQLTIPIGERYFNGGENKVRSFRESELGPKDSADEPVGGMAFNVLSVELRHLLTDNLAASLFFDYGNISPNVAPEQQGVTAYADRQDVIDSTFADYFSNFRPAVGFGLQYLLPVGPARLDLAWNPDRDKKQDEDGFTLHFSIGMAF